MIRKRSNRDDYCVAKNATLRADRPDPSPRKERLLRMTIKPLYGNVTNVAAKLLSAMCRKIHAAH